MAEGGGDGETLIALIVVLTALVTAFVVSVVDVFGDVLDFLHLSISTISARSTLREGR